MITTGRNNDYSSRSIPRESKVSAAIIWSALLLLTLLYLFLIVIPVLGGRYDPNCTFRCPDLDLSWYFLRDIENPDAFLYRLTRLVFTIGPCLEFTLAVFSINELFFTWSRTSSRARAARISILASALLIAILVVANFKFMAHWIFE